VILQLYRKARKPYCGMILLSIDGADGVSDTQEDDTALRRDP
jgi:hypothetical protein